MSSICVLEDPLPPAATDNDETSRAATQKRYPTKAEVLAAIPAECFDRNLFKSSLYLFISLAMPICSGVLAYLFIPLTWSWLPVWLGYAIVA